MTTAQQALAKALEFDAKRERQAAAGNEKGAGIAARQVDKFLDLAVTLEAATLAGEVVAA